MLARTQATGLASRRTALVALPTVLLLSSQAARADERGMASLVIPALKPCEYVACIQANQQNAKNSLIAKIERGKYKNASDDLSIDPFSSVYQSAFYLPFALQKVDAKAAADCQDIFRFFVKDVKTLDAKLIAAQRNQIEEEEVLAALDLVFATLDQVTNTASSVCGA